MGTTIGQPTIKTVLADAKRHGLVVTRAVAKINGQGAYWVKGRPDIFTKIGLMELIGIYG